MRGDKMMISLREFVGKNEPIYYDLSQSFESYLMDCLDCDVAITELLSDWADEELSGVDLFEQASKIYSDYFNEALHMDFNYIEDVLAYGISHYYIDEVERDIEIIVENLARSMFDEYEIEEKDRVEVSDYFKSDFESEILDKINKDWSPANFRESVVDSFLENLSSEFGVKVYDTEGNVAYGENENECERGM